MKTSTEGPIRRALRYRNRRLRKVLLIHNNQLKSDALRVWIDISGANSSIWVP
jgi:hypothetical protein